MSGWTRAHWEATADGLLAAAARYASPGHALINLPGPGPSISGTRSDGLEGFARTYLLAAFRIAGSGGQDPAGLLDRYAEGLDTGTRRPTRERDLTTGAPDAWPVITDRGQAMVEAASIALALRLTRPWLWDRLDDEVRERVGRWLADSLFRAPHDNNWWLFPLTVGGFLADTGIETAAARTAIDTGLAKIEQWYSGEGWYTDGRLRAFDHYNGWALHFYPVLHAHLSGDRPLLDTYGSRLAAYLDGYAATFGADGTPMHQGRSLTYRFAATAPLWAGALSGHTPLPPGATRRLASGALRHFLERGAVTAEGLLSLGWHGSHPPTIQSYSGPASPYWASKAFVGLLLPPDHPVWTATEEPAPSAVSDRLLALPAPGWLIQSTARDGLVRLHNHGSDNQPVEQVLPDNPLYARLAYSTASGPTAAGEAPDNHFGLVIDGTLSERGRIRPLGTGPGWASSTHGPRTAGTELPGVTVTSVVMAHGADEVHAHLVLGATTGTEVRQTGWAVAGEQGEAQVAAGVARVRAVGERPGPQCQLGMVAGFDAAHVVRLAQGTAFGPSAAVPVLTGRVTGLGGQGLFVSTSRLTIEPLANSVDARVRTGSAAGGGWVSVTWPDGTAHRAVLARESVKVSSEPAPGRQ
ncbi:DUF2264 domain-containing protein [Streptomyces sp. NPDC058525]|uniref:DUF2264 domain-containing protein n=1 Tax=Streptomyces sp. NPDC058525 TaxID=3346538 RepID=UPI003653B1E8